jgi:predicted nucleic acid-binding Zn ribbon protein
MPNLISCKACGKEISPNANTCPHCGEPIPKPVEQTVKIVFGIIGGILLAIVLMYFFAH